MKAIALSLLVGLFVLNAFSQRLVSPVVGNYRVPDAVLIAIVKAEDARDARPVIAMFANVNTAVRYRAALAAGRIGDEKALDGLAKLLTGDSTEVRMMAAFAIGEVESIKGAEAILTALKAETRPVGSVPSVRARLVEAAGKIVAANPKDPRAKELGQAILDALKNSDDRQTALLGLTAVLRARPDKGDEVASRFLSSMDARVRADAANTMTRLKAKNANDALSQMLKNDVDPVARANAARALGAAEDKGALNILLDAATKDADPRVRVSAIRSVGALKDANAADRLLVRAETLLAAAKRSRYKHPVENAEMIEISTVLGRLLAATKNARAVKFLDQFALFDNGLTADVSIARMRIEPSGDFDNSKSKGMGWHEMSTDAQVLGEIADLDKATYGDGPEIQKLRNEAPDLLLALLSVFGSNQSVETKSDLKAIPDVLTAYAKFKPANLDEVLRNALANDDVFIRATAAGLMADRPNSPENMLALKRALDHAIVFDRMYNDGALAAMDALYKMDKKGAVSSLLTGLGSPDHLVRKKAFELLADPELANSSEQTAFLIKNAREHNGEQLMQNRIGFPTKMGQVINTNADYSRALSRKNGTVKAVIATEKGTFTIVFNPEEAPLTVDNFIKLARVGYFNGLEVHRVVPNFVMQDGDPRGDGNGGPGWSIRCEVNMLPYDRGAVGMALSGKDTGGSQWFVTHSPQPHLDGGYTVFGHVSEADMKVVDSIVRGDKILTVKIIGR